MSFVFLWPELLSKKTFFSRHPVYVYIYMPYPGNVLYLSREGKLDNLDFAIFFLYKYANIFQQHVVLIIY